jgi:uncharacterized membrane protein
VSRERSDPGMEALGAAALRGMRALEGAAFLDRPAESLANLVDGVLASPRLKRFLRGSWLGHSFHPLLTDFTEGPWMAATFLDLFGPEGSSPAARRLVAFGLVMALPTHVSGLADWAAARGDGERRVGLVHTASVSLATVLYAASYLERRRRHQRRATLLGLAGGTIALLDGYLGGHLSHVRGLGVGETA